MGDEWFKLYFPKCNLTSLGTLFLFQIEMIMENNIIFLIDFWVFVNENFSLHTNIYVPHKNHHQENLSLRLFPKRKVIVHVTLRKVAYVVTTIPKNISAFIHVDQEQPS